MKTNRLFSLTLLGAAFAILVSCSEQEDPKFTFVSAGRTLSLDGAKLYLTSSEVGYNNHNFRYYSITDGIFTNGGGEGGWSADDYTGETYHLIIAVGEPNGLEPGIGEYPQNSDWSNETLTEVRIGYVKFSYGDVAMNKYKFQEWLTNEIIDDTSPVIISGGMNDNEKMKITFSGELTWLFYPVNGGGNVMTSTAPVELNFSGIVNDER